MNMEPIVNAWWTGHEPLIRGGIFAGVFGVMSLWELVSRRRPLVLPKARRWIANLGLVAVASLLVRLSFGTAAIGVALLAEKRAWGVLNQLEMPTALAVVASVFALDLAIYLQHVMFHAVPLLWRLHMVHHADLDFDVTTGLRFHPLEILVSMGIKMALVLLIGAPPVGVLIFEVLLNATSMFNHGNVKMPAGVDRVLRWFVVTPDMHRVHHSTDPRETNSNFGFNLACWDRLLGTYLDQPHAGHDAIEIGLEQFRKREPQSLWWMLTLPFGGRLGNYPMGRR